MEVWEDLRRGLAVDGVDDFRRRPSAAAALGLRDLVIREERAGVAWKDISLWALREWFVPHPVLRKGVCSERGSVVEIWDLEGTRQQQ